MERSHVEFHRNHRRLDKQDQAVKCLRERSVHREVRLLRSTDVFEPLDRRRIDALLRGLEFNLFIHRVEDRVRQTHSSQSPHGQKDFVHLLVHFFKHHRHRQGTHGNHGEGRHKHGGGLTFKSVPAQVFGQKTKSSEKEQDADDVLVDFVEELFHVS